MDFIWCQPTIYHAFGGQSTIYRAVLNSVIFPPRDVKSQYHGGIQLLPDCDFTMPLILVIEHVDVLILAGQFNGT